MELHPLPELARKRLPLVEFGGPFFRIHYSRDDALYFCRRRLHRFDSPDGDYGVLYAGEDMPCAFVETLGHHTGHNLVQEQDLAIRSVATLRPSRELHLVDLRSSGLAKLGADARLCAGPHRLAQQWSKAFFVHRDKPDGICYPARHDPSKYAVALFDRVGKLMGVTESMVLLDHPLLSQVLNHYGFGLA